MLPVRASFEEREIEMAKLLIESMSTKWSPKSYRDTYRERVEDLIEQKRQGTVVVTEGPRQEPAPVVDLLAALQASVSAARNRSATGTAAEEATEPEPKSRPSRKRRLEDHVRRPRRHDLGSRRPRRRPRAAGAARRPEPPGGRARSAETKEQQCPTATPPSMCPRLRAGGSVSPTRAAFRRHRGDRARKSDGPNRGRSDNRRRWRASRPPGGDQGDRPRRPHVDAGLIDAHTHLSGHSARTLRGAEEALAGTAADLHQQVQFRHPPSPRGAHGTDRRLAGAATAGGAPGHALRGLSRAGQF